MITLDCETRDSALGSVSLIYEVPAKEIDGFLRETDLERHYATNNPEHPGDEELTLLFERAFDCTPTAIDRVFWFHLTRAKPDSDFASGILPLSEALPGVWDTIMAIFRGTAREMNLRNLKEKGVPDFQYGLKVGQPLHAGPYAMLVRDSAFRSKEMSNHDYLWLPEIVEDICNGYHASYGDMIHDEVCEALVPYIVKFWSDKKIGKSCVESAMYYLYSTAHGQDLSICANTCFDGKNCRVPQEQIVKIEKVQDVHNRFAGSD